MTVSAERGLELYNIYDKAIKGKEFADHLHTLRKKNGTKPLAIFMDQLKVHSDKSLVKDLY